MPAAYSFVSRWEIPAAPERCWRELERLLRDGTVSWWAGVAVEGAPVAAAVGARCVLAVQSPLGYRLRARLTLTAVDPGRQIAAASAGDLRGAGRIEVRDAPGGSIVTVNWDVVTARRWMNATAFVLWPLFAVAHGRVMGRGERGLRAVVERGQ